MRRSKGNSNRTCRLPPVASTMSQQTNHPNIPQNRSRPSKGEQLPTTNEPLKADANPTKAFFVRMLTRDVSLEDSILDLIDNSIDSAWQREGSKPMQIGYGPDLSRYQITISANDDKFSIRDNCGSMTLHDAQHHAFSFGREVGRRHDPYSIGVYGIGMKRAAFKLGGDIRIRNTFKNEAGSTQAFAVRIDVDEWLRDDEPPWTFEIDRARPRKHHGLTMQVSNLTREAQREFSNPGFIQTLTRTVRRDYTLHLDRGLQIRLNDQPVSSLPLNLRSGTEFAPMRIKYRDPANDQVEVEIIAGMAATPPDSVDPGTRPNSDRPFGWYVACNGRVVLAADKTILSGWGTRDWPQWHRQYAGFLGLVMFSAPDAGHLPLTTTKRNVDTSSDVYLRARPKMRQVTKEWIAYTNVRKTALDTAKKKEAQTEPISIYQIESRATTILPQLTPIAEERRGNIHYSKRVSRIKALGNELGSPYMPYSEVGRQSFEIAYDALVGDE